MALLQSHPNEQLKRRIRFEAHDFFTPQPVQGAAVYLLRSILHDHPDDEAIQILRNIVPAVNFQSRIICMDGVLPELNAMSKSAERDIRLMDIEMMSMLNARERELADWKALFAAADERLKLRNVVAPPGSVNAVMEVVLLGRKE